MNKQVHDPETILKSYADGPTLLDVALSELKESDLNLSLSSDSWTVRQIVHHIVDGDDIWKICVKGALGNNNGIFSLQWYWDKSQIHWSKKWNYATHPLETSLALFHANRRHILELISQTPNAWEKSIRIKTPQNEEGRITIGEILDMQSSHVIEHIGEIQAILHSHVSPVS
ncbi:MAG TPA: DinB family protein [Anaerolineales bacterium]|nr:DinB family protein [Anaerolineales bacterium]